MTCLQYERVCWKFWKIVIPERFLALSKTSEQLKQNFFRDWNVVFLVSQSFWTKDLCFSVKFYMCVQWFFMSLRYNLGRLAVSQRTCPHSGWKNVDVSISEDEVNFKQPLSDLGISDKQKKREWELGGIEKKCCLKRAEMSYWVRICLFSCTQAENTLLAWPKLPAFKSSHIICVKCSLHHCTYENIFLYGWLRLSKNSWAYSLKLTDYIFPVWWLVSSQRNGASQTFIILAHTYSQAGRGGRMMFDRLDTLDLFRFCRARKVSLILLLLIHSDESCSNTLACLSEVTFPC